MLISPLQAKGTPDLVDEQAQAVLSLVQGAHHCGIIIKQTRKGLRLNASNPDDGDHAEEKNSLPSAADGYSIGTFLHCYCRTGSIRPGIR